MEGSAIASGLISGMPAMSGWSCGSSVSSIYDKMSYSGMIVVGDRGGGSGGMEFGVDTCGVSGASVGSGSGTEPPSVVVVGCEEGPPSSLRGGG